MTRRVRRGTTILELAIFSGIGLVVMALIWGVFAGATRRGARTAAKLEGVEGALVLSSWLEDDLQAVHDTASTPISFREEDGLQVLVFTRYGPTSAEDSWESRDLVQVEYVFDPVQRQVLRTTEPGGTRRLPGTLSELAAWVEGGPGGYRLVYRMVATGDGSTGGREVGGPGACTVLAGAVSLRDRSAAAAYPFWHKEVYGAPDPVPGENPADG